MQIKFFYAFWSIWFWLASQWECRCVTVTSSTALHFPASLWAFTCTQLNHSHLISIRESSSPVSKLNQALYKTALIPNTRLWSRVISSSSVYSPMLDRCGCLPPVDSTKGRARTTNSSVYWASLNSDLLYLPVEMAFSLFNKEAYFTHPHLPLILYVTRLVLLKKITT